MSVMSPIDVITAIMKGLRDDCPDVMFSPRTSCEQHKGKPGWKSADLVLYSHNCTDLELRLHMQDNGEYVITAAPDNMSQMCKSYIVGFINGLYDAGAIPEPTTGREKTVNIH